VLLNASDIDNHREIMRDPSVFEESLLGHDMLQLQVSSTMGTRSISGYAKLLIAFNTAVSRKTTNLSIHKTWSSLATSGTSDRHGIWQMRYVAYPKHPGGQILFGVYDLANEAVSTKETKVPKPAQRPTPGSVLKGLTDRLTHNLFLRARVSHQSQALANRAQNAYVVSQPSLARIQPPCLA
jgi:hypothetical protein